MKRPGSPSNGKLRVTEGQLPRHENPAAKRRLRIAAIKAEVEAGIYVVDPLAVSNKIIDAHLRKKKLPS